MRNLLSASIFALLVAAPGCAAPAYANDDAPLSATPAPVSNVTINQVIEQTNFIVADQCSGTLISVKYKLVLTNNHCLEGYVDKTAKDEVGDDGTIENKTREVFKDMELKQKTYADFKEVSSASYQARILFHTDKYDLALLKMKSDAIPQTIWSQVLPEDKKVIRGDHVFVVGNPYMLDANLTEGVVSSINRTLHWGETNEDVDYYGVDAGINPGNSGGALYNQDLNLIGVPAAKISNSTGLGFAIPAETIRAFLKSHCYEDVYNNKAKSHDECMQAKFDKVNDARIKAGKPALDKPLNWDEQRDSRAGKATAIETGDTADVKPAKPAPAAAAAKPGTLKDKSLSTTLMDWVDSFGWVQSRQLGQ